MSSIIELSLKNQTVRIEKGELISYKVDDYEFIHQKGSPGWSSSDTEMFPIIGPVFKADYQVQTPKGLANQDQHGHLRQMDYQLVENTNLSAVYKKSYTAKTIVENAKYPEKSPKRLMDWPYDFEFEKIFKLTKQGLSIDFVISGDKNMPFMLGYHPTFKLNTETPTINTKDREITLNEVLAVGSRALQVADCEFITLKDEKEITIKTEGFGHFMCWTEVRNMVCVEPISFYPYAVTQNNIHEGFQHLKDKSRFKVFLSPGV
jgi:galactose mutarotase-like enzyme